MQVEVPSSPRPESANQRNRIARSEARRGHATGSFVGKETTAGQLAAEDERAPRVGSLRVLPTLAKAGRDAFRLAHRLPLRGALAGCPGVLFAAVPDPSLVTSIFSPESTPAHEIVRLAGLVLIITAAIFAPVFGLIIYVIARFRRRSGDDGAEPAQVYGSNPLEMAWTIVPILIVVVLALTTARVIHEIQDHPKPANAIDVQVIGHQFWWEIRYPKLGVVAANEIHVPVSSPTRPTPTFLDLRSADVAHNFWVPRLAGKTELIPNKDNTMWLEPERTGLFLGQCAEFCGTQHALMLIRVYVDSAEQFDEWVKHQKTRAADDPKGARGLQVFEQNACINCHALNGTVGNGRFGPDLTHLMSRATLAAGAMGNSKANLRAWIKEPDHFKPGVLMPAMNLNDQDLDSLVDYLLTLK